MEERLQKIIARAGIASRRHAEQLILSGQVAVNGKTVMELGSKADAEKDHIRVVGKLLQGAGSEEKLYLAFNKPPGVVATMFDPEGRKSLAGFVRKAGGRVYPVGRLDFHATGLILLTNDGELADGLMRAHGLPQTYWVKVKGEIRNDEMDRLGMRAGVRVRRVQGSGNPWYETKMPAGRMEKLKEELKWLGHPVEKVRRVKMAGIELADLPPGESRALGAGEVEAIRKMLLSVGKTAAPFVKRGPAGQHPTRQEDPSRERVRYEQARPSPAGPEHPRRAAGRQERGSDDRTRRDRGRQGPGRPEHMRHGSPTQDRSRPGGQRHGRGEPARQGRGSQGAARPEFGRRSPGGQDHGRSRPGGQQAGRGGPARQDHAPQGTGRSEHGRRRPSGPGDARRGPSRPHHGGEPARQNHGGLGAGRLVHGRVPGKPDLGKRGPGGQGHGGPRSGKPQHGGRGAVGQDPGRREPSGPRKRFGRGGRGDFREAGPAGKGNRE
jgi:23S rRNA pseudouridine2605 synthase